MKVARDIGIKLYIMEKSTGMSEIRELPVISLKSDIIFPGILIHFDLTKKEDIKAVEEALRSNGQIFLTARRAPESTEVTMDELFDVGTISNVKQFIRLPGNMGRVLVMGQGRGRILELETEGNYPIALVEDYGDADEEYPEAMQRAVVASIRESLEEYNADSKLGKESFKQLMQMENAVKLINAVAVQLPIALKDKQALLEAEGLAERHGLLKVILKDEIEIQRFKKEINDKVKSRVDKNQKEYILKEQMKVIRGYLGDRNQDSEADEYLEATEKLNADDYVKEKLTKEIERFRTIPQSSAESSVSRDYIELLLDLPWNNTSEENLDIANARKILDEDHYGLEKVKERILEFLAVRKLTDKGDSPIICLVGPPGTGKTSIARSVARALNKEYVRICLGGVRDEAEIRGHRRTYVGAMAGRLVAGLKAAGTGNPLMLLDEIDKVSNDYKGDPSAALLEVLDSEQNSKFVDHYVDMPVDLSKVMFICTANSVQTISRPLLDRMEVIEVNSYTANEKLHIAKDYLVTKQLKKNGLKKSRLSISDKALEMMISGYTKEAGVRNLERTIGKVCRKAACELLEDENIKKINVSAKNLKNYLGKVKYTFDPANNEAEVGIVRGLAWTSAGGDTLQIEVNTMPGTGKFELTGQLGDVMKESAKTGVSFVRSVAGKYSVEPEFFEKNDIHIHIPEGAVPKDGPSAGITMATAMLSAITGKKVYPDVAMTGEITLRGRVLPIGGLKEKILAAKTAGIKRVVLPEKNKGDVEEISEEILEGIDLCFVNTMDEVLAVALCR